MFLVLMCSVAAYLIWNESMKALGQVTANNYLYGQPIVTMVVAAFIFHDPVTLLGVCGCILIISGLIISDKVSEIRCAAGDKKPEEGACPLEIND